MYSPSLTSPVTVVKSFPNSISCDEKLLLPRHGIFTKHTHTHKSPLLVLLPLRDSQLHNKPTHHYSRIMCFAHVRTSDFSIETRLYWLSTRDHRPTTDSDLPSPPLDTTRPCGRKVSNGVVTGWVNRISVRWTKIRVQVVETNLLGSVWREETRSLRKIFYFPRGD